MADEAVDAVTSLISKMEKSEAAIASLRDQSESIGSVLGVIEGIAEQRTAIFAADEADYPPTIAALREEAEAARRR